MIAIQAALLAAALKVFIDQDAGLFPKMPVIIILAGLGVISSCFWIAMHNGQNQYLEYCRRTLRNLEHRLVDLGVPLRYFTLEAQVFGPPPAKKEVPRLAGTATWLVGKGLAFAEFEWADDRYPDVNTLYNSKGVHELAKVGGSLKDYEKYIAYIILLIWFLAPILAFFAQRTY